MKKILYEAHSGCLSVHSGSTKMYNDLKKSDISEFASKCLICQQVKAEHQVPSGLLQPSSKKKDAIWVVIDQLTKSTHFIPVYTDYSLNRLAELYIDGIVRLHGVPISIISDKDPRFTSQFWKKLQEALGKKLNFSTAFHLIELSERRIHGVDLIKEIEEKVKVIHDYLKEASDLSPWKKTVRFGWKGKLSSRFIGPYEIIERIGPMEYQLALPIELEKIPNVFQ
ncbi:integrase [Gossypium australe]|uniref:Integrase n=1 Tax=Gossypium australe TaxID=47621 RepID=A0A5B6UTT3_9ROSI|nr:integrase [Gossypium australe]